MKRLLFKRVLFTCTLAASTGLMSLSPSAQLRADEQPSSMYEDDAWYDVNEWFDGNDYNPTDEAFFRWDDETYGIGDAANSSDVDSDTSIFGYKESTPTDSNWYYDYDYSDYYTYDDWDSNGLYEYASRFYDYDNDGYYDAFAGYVDRDGDGFYEDYTYATFSSSTGNASQKDAARKNSGQDTSDRSSKMYAVNGTVAKTKKVKGRNGERLLAHVKMDDRKFVIDLGSVDGLDTKIAEGDALTARGPVAKVGDKQILVAKEIEHQGQSLTINRSPRGLQGEVVETMQAAPRKGQPEHIMVKMKTNDGRRALVDLGPADKLNMDLQQGAKIGVSGITIKLKDRPILLATQVEKDGKQVKIERTRTSPSGTK